MLLSNFISWWPCSSFQSQAKSVASAHSSSSESGSTSDSDSSSDSETESHSSDSEGNDAPRAPTPEVNAKERQRLLPQPLASLCCLNAVRAGDLEHCHWSGVLLTSLLHHSTFLAFSFHSTVCQPWFPLLPTQLDFQMLNLEVFPRVLWHSCLALLEESVPSLGKQEKAQRESTAGLCGAHLCLCRLSGCLYGQCQGETRFLII